MAYFTYRLLLFFLVAVITKASQVHTVKVGFGGNFVFDPATTTADVGDLVVFEFFPTNHSVVRGEYAASGACGSQCNPCVPYEMIHPGQQGFHSENVLTQSVSLNGNGPNYTIAIGDDNPIWFYCTAIDSCRKGMVGVINPASGQSIDIQKSAAISADYQLAPGQPWPAEGSTTDTQPSTTSAPSKKSKSQQVSSGAIAGIVIGILLATAITAALVFFVRRAKQKTKPKSSEEDSMSLTEADAEEQTVPVSMRYEPVSTPSPSGLVSPITPPPQRKESLMKKVFYRYNFTEKPLAAPKGHPAFGPGANQGTTIELEGDENFDRTSRQTFN